MKHRDRILLFILLLSAVMLLTGCGTDKAVQNIAACINKNNCLGNNSDFFYSGKNPMIELKSQPILEPYFRITDLKTTVDKQDKNIVHYSAKIPGLVGSVFNIVYGKDFPLNETYSPPVEVEGEIKFVWNQNKSKTWIDVSDRQNPNIFTIYAMMRYANTQYLSTLPAFQGNEELIPKDLSQTDVSEGLPYINTLLGLYSYEYSHLLNVNQNEFTADVIDRELETYINHFASLWLETDPTVGTSDKTAADTESVKDSAISTSDEENESGFLAWLKALPWYFSLPLILLGLILLSVVLVAVFIKIFDLFKR